MKSTFQILLIISGLYILLCLLAYVLQEKLLFFPGKLDADYEFEFDGDFKEVNIPVEEDVNLHALLFKSVNSKGLIFYLHGNAGSLEAWGRVGETYDNFGYDTFILDYRGYGKSDGRITGEDQLFSDVQIAYDYIKKLYNEEDIIILGYSVGTGPASKLASANNPKLLILQAPFYSLVDMMKNMFPIFPEFLLKYRFENNRYIPDCTMPIVIFHGTNDEVIPYEQSLKLKPLLKASDTLVTLKGEGHNGMTYNAAYLESLREILGD
ncbi:alpha/beta hydrolase [Lunatibacter salilacus]|uniref:alpha/beta hydrolase n=1 Tax=Lunatibacter salilacus TaxID=2483804 RepID=UPI00131D5813|nr:alpha/beta fold hydrolase [Lunatibacter salilacus]